MKWNPTGLAAYSQLSLCGRYSVCRIGNGPGMFYELWRTRAHEDGPHLVATNLPDSDAARAMADADQEEA